ncbi:MAG: FtsX-like permease family protein, partial [Chloroflexi bacterium]|nr:FtsX-like permease family protein [Chloroflexota bacterium]
GMVENALTGSLQESNGGDIRIAPSADRDVSSEVAQQGRDLGYVESVGGNAMAGHNQGGNDYFTPAGLEAVQNWFADNVPGSTLTSRQMLTGGVGLMSAASISNPRTDSDQTFITPYFVDTQVYPLYGDRLSEEGEALSDLILAPTDIVISRNLADTLDAKVGDTLRMSGSSTDFTLRGIVPTDSEDGLKNMGGALFGYCFLDLGAVDLFTESEIGIDLIYARLDDPAQVETINEEFGQQFPFFQTVNTIELEDQNETISETLNQLVMVMGLVSLLIGGIGIVNTMQVVVSRRTTEIAVLKTLGLEGDQVTTLFLVQAVVMGVIGSVIGVVLGWLAAYATKGIAGAFIAHTLEFRLTASPAIMGLIVGVLVTTIFGLMPTLAAGQVRPNLVLRPSDTMIPRAGRLRSFIALVIVIAALSLVAQSLIGDLLSARMIRIIAGGIGAVLGLLVAGLTVGSALINRKRQAVTGMQQAAPLLVIPAGFAFGYLIPALLILMITFVIVGVLYTILWALIWGVAKFFPSGWLVDLKVALRSMLAVRGRVASTLLALVIGVFTLSLVTMLADAITNRFETMLVDETGGNVMVFASGQADTLERVEQQLIQMDGVYSYAVVGTYNVELITLEDVSAGQVLSYDELKARTDAEAEPQMIGHGGRGLSRYVSAIDARDVDSNLPDVTMYRGRQLTASDASQPVIVVTANEKTLAAGFDVGDKLTFRLDGSSESQEITLEIVGMIDRTSSEFSSEATSPNYAPLGAFPTELQPDSVKAVIDLDESQIGNLRRAMNQIPGAFVLETRLINDVINRVVNQFTSFPILVASLALVVGGIVIANSVALSTMERRREIAIMKAVGLQRERVLGMLLLENGLMGLIGGLIGVGMGGAILLMLLLEMFGGDLGSTIPYLTGLGLMALCIVIALAAAVITAWGASGEKPLNVLRYE